jgi:hypothetical protein
MSELDELADDFDDIVLGLAHEATRADIPIPSQCLSDLAYATFRERHPELSSIEMLVAMRHACRRPL